MARNHDHERSQALFQKLQYITAPSRTADMPFALSPRELRKMKKFRFQLPGDGKPRFATEKVLLVINRACLADLGANAALFALTQLAAIFGINAVG